jgi:hypothetical protein
VQTLVLQQLVVPAVLRLEFLTPLHHTAYTTIQNRLATAGTTVAIYNYTSALLLNTAQFSSTVTALGCAWSSDGKSLCVCGDAGQIAFYRTEGRAGRGLVRVQGGMVGGAVPQTFHCCAYTGNGTAGECTDTD